ncbi:MAG: YitT family protein [Oscillospiraceae bacterium]|nr:YitT family protein [Oscillospiraceae bacterium]MDD4367890.1 YitT family protein [Oscillospiraceae bacterium]
MKKYPLIQRLVNALVGAFVAAAAVNLFFLPPKLTMGGISGVAAIVYTLTSYQIPIPYGLWVILLNLPIFLAGRFFVSRRFVWDSLIGTVLYSIVIDLTEQPMSVFYERYLAPQAGAVPDLFLSAFVGGALYGLGLGLMLRGGFTTGGTDIIAVLLRRRHQFSLGQWIGIMDVLVIAASGFFYRNTPDSSIQLMLYSFLAMLVTSKAVDLILEGFDYKRTVFIISSQNEKIASRVLKELDRGATMLNGRGMYTKSEQDVLLCVLAQKEIPVLQAITKEEDRDAFMFVMDTREVLGEGFEGSPFLL